MDLHRRKQLCRAPKAQSIGLTYRRSQFPLLAPLAERMPDRQGGERPSFCMIDGALPARVDHDELGRSEGLFNRRQLSTLLGK